MEPEVVYPGSLGWGGVGEGGAVPCCCREEWGGMCFPGFVYVAEAGYLLQA